METVRFSETLASTNECTLRLNPEEHHHYRDRRENLKSHIIWQMFTTASTSETSVNFYQTTLPTTQKTAIFILAAMRT
jgi:hypothetical protein